MLKAKIENVAARLGELAGRVDEETWDVLRNARAELKDAAEQAGNLETVFAPAVPETATRQ